MQRYPFDLHTHSNASDGDFPPEHIFRSAKRFGLRGVVLTDHNTTVTIEEAQRLARRFRVETLEGVEISARAFGVELHLLGYARAFNRDRLERSLARTQRGYTDKVKLQVARARRQGLVSIRFADVVAIRPRATFYVKYDLIRALARLPGWSVERAKQQLNRGGDLFVPYGSWAMSPNSVVRLIRDAGGIVSFAHLGEARRALRKTFGAAGADRKLVMLVAGLWAAGLRGIELRHISNTPDDVRFLRSLVRRHHLIPTGGSDYHGKHHHPKRRLGQFGLTTAEYRRWHAALP